MTNDTFDFSSVVECQHEWDEPAIVHSGDKVFHNLREHRCKKCSAYQLWNIDSTPFAGVYKVIGITDKETVEIDKEKQGDK
jgi:hypothetical protein